jgi:hypothetical protein
MVVLGISGVGAALRMGIEGVAATYAEEKKDLKDRSMKM